MPRNLILCLDGTSNRFKRDNTNVLKWFAMLSRSGEEQVLYYQPGIGTSTPLGIYGRLAKRVIRLLDLAFAILLKQHVCDAYRFLMRTYRPGDRIYIFGFSRGAYSARVLAGMIHAVGLLSAHNDEMLDYAWDMYKRFPEDDEGWKQVARFKKIFGARAPEPKIELLGLWDTVSSVRYLGRDLNFRHTRDNPSVLHVRHAVALDERRAYFRQNTWKPFEQVPKQDPCEVWFAGVHCDVGGGYFATESGLANVALQWMRDECSALPNPVLFDDSVAAEYLVSRDGENVVCPDPLAGSHESLKWYWWPLELLPRKKWVPDANNQYHEKIVFPLGRRRVPLDGCKVHHSVQQRIAAGMFARGLLPENVIFVAAPAAPASPTAQQPSAA